MHYRNGRDARNGDTVVQLDTTGKIVGMGVLFDAKPDNDFCNGRLAEIPAPSYACLVDCLHIDDIAELLAAKGLYKRPPGK